MLIRFSFKNLNLLKLVIIYATIPVLEEFEIDY